MTWKHVSFHSPRPRTTGGANQPEGALTPAKISARKQSLILGGRKLAASWQKKKKKNHSFHLVNKEHVLVSLATACAWPGHS